jgi:hypothetical protein
MSCYRSKAPKITWGAGFANTLNIGYPLDNWTISSKGFEESTFLQIESGEEDAWIINTEYYLEGDIRFIPIEDSVNPTQTGWDGATGCNSFLISARAKNIFRFFPDKDEATYIESYLVEPISTSPSVESDGTRTIRIIIRNTTTPYNGY